MPKGFFFFLFSKFLLQLLYNVVLVSTVQQSESAICIHMYPSGGFLPTMPKDFGQDQISRIFCLRGPYEQKRVSANCVFA